VFDQEKTEGSGFVTQASDLPDQLPIFPLSGVLLLPAGRLPINVFEPRYLAMVEDALANKRLIGMVLPTGVKNPDGGSGVFQVGCAGRIHSLNETDDGRYLIGLLGVCRFRITQELDLQKGYRRVSVNWADFLGDLDPVQPAKIDRTQLMRHVKKYFKLQGVHGDWDMIEKTNDNKLINALAMICPFMPSEKQALLEACTLEDRCALLMTLMDMALVCDDDQDVASVKH